MAANAGAKTCHGTLTTTAADAVTLSDKVSHVRVSNHHATVPLYVTVKTGNSAAGAAGATIPTSGIDESIGIPPLATKEVLNSPSVPVFVSLGVVGNANAYSVEGSRTPFNSNF